MFTVNSSQGKFTAYIQADYKTTAHGDAFSLSRTMLRLERNDDQKTSVYGISYMWTGGSSVVMLPYYSDPDGVLEIPLRNVVASHIGDTIVVNLHLYETDHSLVDQGGLQLDAYKGISYGDMLAPRGKDVNVGDFMFANRHDVILPPNVMLNPNIAGGFTSGVVVESNYHTLDGDATWTASSGGGLGNAISPSGDRTNMIYVTAAMDALTLTTGKNQDIVKTWEMIKPDQCADIACVQWTSLTGALRRHYFPVVSYINGVDKELSVVEAGNGYDIRKNAFKGVRCRLTGLTPYGCWYYQDLLQASDAHALVNRTWSLGDELSSMESAVLVEGGMEATPEGNGFFSFEFTLKLRHYDTV